MVEFKDVGLVFKSSGGGLQRPQVEIYLHQATIIADNIWNISWSDGQGVWVGVGGWYNEEVYQQSG